MVMVG